MTGTLIREAQKAGVGLKLVDGKVSIIGPRAAVDAWGEKLRQAKGEIILALSASAPHTEPIRPQGLSPTLMAASLALDARYATEKVLLRHSLKKDVCPNLDTPPDRATERRELFMRRGLTEVQAMAQATRLEIRDVDLDRRALCLECTHLAGYGTSWRCTNWQAAGVAVQARDSALPVDLVMTLQHCHDFVTSLPIKGSPK